MAYTFTLSGELISKEKMNISSVVIGRDSNFMSHLITTSRDELTLAFRKLPSLKSQMLLLKKKPTMLTVFENQRMIVIGDEAGEFTFLWDPRSIIKD